MGSAEIGPGSFDSAEHIWAGPGKKGEAAILALFERKADMMNQIFRGARLMQETNVQTHIFPLRLSHATDGNHWD